VRPPRSLWTSEDRQKVAELLSDLTTSLERKVGLWNLWKGKLEEGHPQIPKVEERTLDRFSSTHVTPVT